LDKRQIHQKDLSNVSKAHAMTLNEVTAARLLLPTKNNGE